MNRVYTVEEAHFNFEDDEKVVLFSDYESLEKDNHALQIMLMDDQHKIKKLEQEIQLLAEDSINLDRKIAALKSKDNVIKDKSDLIRIRCSQMIEDPFPEHTSYQMTIDTIEEHRKCVGRLFGLKCADMKAIPKPKPISIHEAYQIGYDKAYREIEEALKGAKK